MAREAHNEYARFLTGGSRKKKHFLDKRLKVDVAISVIEQVLDTCYRFKGAVKQRNRLYHGAGLLYYLGFESFFLRSGEPFPDPDHLKKDDPICRRYHAKRGEAKKYLPAMDEGGKRSEDRWDKFSREIRAHADRLVGEIYQDGKTQPTT